MFVLLSLVLSLGLPGVQDGTATFGVLLAPAAATGTESDFVRGARLALDQRNEQGGVHGRTLGLAIETVGDAKDVPDAVAKLVAGGAAAVALGPVDEAVEKAARKACERAGLPVIGFGVDPDATANALEDILIDRLRLGYLVVLHGSSSAPKRFAKDFKKRLDDTAPVVWMDTLAIKDRKLAAKLEDERVDAFLLEGDPDEALETARRIATISKAPVFLTPSSYRTGLALPASVYFFAERTSLLGATGVAYRASYQELHGHVPPLQADRGCEAMTLLIGALAAATGELGRMGEALAELSIDGPRGRVGLVERKDGWFVPEPLALYTMAGDAPLALLPGPEGSGVTSLAERPKRRWQPSIGVGFGDDRTNQFQLEPETQGVIFGYGNAKESTIDEDLRLLGLSSAGACPLADHLVKEEILARMLAITSEKFLRNPDGTSRPGESFAISFAARLPKKAKTSQLWRLIIAGDDPDAGGRAFPGLRLARTFSSFLRRTIYDKHAMDPPLNAEDLPGLLGNKTLDPFYNDVRAAEIHALIDGYAGGLSLTSAHELGHLAGLGHVTDDPRGIMNVNEGAGLDYRDANFSAGSRDNMTRTLGVVPAPRRP